ncbi:MAG: nicotinate (nicotinamide) nucleotide adenylyltransferase [Bacteroidota bacterium]|nr:nicotinate (nicotinamide) nucleotide adenylyltransferase [Bacteroidota bacterium]
MKKTGLFFGTFNPIHNGHLELAQYFINHTDIGEIFFIVTPLNPFKKKSVIVDNKDRLRMVEAATSGEKNFYPSDIEFKISAPNYTIKTILKIKEENPNVSYSLLMGKDNLSSFDQWKEYESILKNVELYVYPRKIKYSVPVVLENHPRIKIFEAPLINFSSTEIRNRIKKNKEVKELLPNKVLDYIKQKKLYS